MQFPVLIHHDYKAKLKAKNAKEKFKNKKGKKVVEDERPDSPRSEAEMPTPMIEMKVRKMTMATSMLEFNQN